MNVQELQVFSEEQQSKLFNRVLSLTVAALISTCMSISQPCNKIITRTTGVSDVDGADIDNTRWFTHKGETSNDFMFLEESSGCSLVFRLHFANSYPYLRSCMHEIIRCVRSF
ncbi:hypothetical protein AMECASPLE_034087 [Ameca splendens]|uniref:Uncharacterized protein n=1 Tax=Ameca splendens TaxID=208324 RepID=A0ABV0XWH1_9TELE